LQSALEILIEAQEHETLIDGQDEDKDMDSLVAMLKRLDIAVDY
jgi:hypothetical protein